MRKYFNGLIYFLEQDPINPEKQNIGKSLMPNIPGSAATGSIGGLGQQNPSQPTDPSLDLLPDEEPMEFTDIGKVFVLKKIYAKLLSIDNLLKNYTDDKFVSLKKDVEEVIDMFHTVVSNIDKVKEDLDNYIKLFQDFTLNAIKKLDSINNKED